MKQAVVSVLFLGYCAFLSATPQSASSVPNPRTRLLTAKILYVARMPDNLDQWLIADLKTWGRYQITASPQGVDLEIRAKVPARQPRYSVRGGVPVERKQKQRPPVLSITLVDWVTGEKLWQADILNSGLKNNANSPPGPEAKIDARHMTPDQIAQRCATDLRRYVTQLEQQQAKK
ncbi:MAG: hypothetical protein ACRD2B_18715 [Terriglobia bacterium]